MCLKLRVYRGCRAGHVSRREAGVFYTLKPKIAALWGPVVVMNEVCLANPLVADANKYNFGDLAPNAEMEALWDAAMAVWRGEFNKRNSPRYLLSDAVFAAFYKYDLALAEYLRAAKYDSVIVGSSVWVL